MSNIPRILAIGLTLIVAAPGSPVFAQTGACWTDDEVLRRNPNPSREQQLAPWPAHRIVDNIYYVGTRNLASYLIATADGLVLINTNDGQTLPLIRTSVEELGFEWSDIRIILGSHAHADHMSATAAAKEQTGAQVVVMREDVPLLVEMSPAGSPQLVDRTIDHLDTVTLGGLTLTAHLTPGHTPGTTTWTTTVTENGKQLEVVFLGGATATPRSDVTSPEIQRQFHSAFIELRSLRCDVPLGPHSPVHNMEEKFRRLQAEDGTNPFVDPAGCQDELALSERGFYLLLAKQLGTRP